MLIKEKKHRLEKEFYRGKISVAFTLCVKDRVVVFNNMVITDIFTDLLKKTADKYRCVIPVYCFMPDHQHLIISGTEDEVNLLKVCSEYKQKTGFWLAKNKMDAGWQKGFFDHVIRKDESLSAYIKYILDNPVRNGLVCDWRDYPFKGSIGCNLDDILMGII